MLRYLLFLAAFPGVLPASFVAELPPEDGVSSRAILELHEDQGYVLRNSVRRESTGETTHYDDIGRWVVASSGNGQQLVLRNGSAVEIVFRSDGPDRVIPLDQRGEPHRMAGKVVRLQRATGLSFVEPQLFLNGTYVYMADAGEFTECLTGWRMPVVMEGDHAALERARLDARAGPGEAMRVSLEGRIVWRPGPDGGKPRRMLVPVQMGRAWPGETCESP